MDCMDRILCAICESFCDGSVKCICGHVCCSSCVAQKEWGTCPGGALCPRCSLRKACGVAGILRMRCWLCGCRAEKECLLCEEGCCRSHSEQHLNLPSSSPGHLLVNVGDLHKWTCQRHAEYMTHYCEDEQRGLCQQCGVSICVKQNHRVSNIFQSRQIQTKLTSGRCGRSSQETVTSSTSQINHKIFKSFRSCGISAMDTQGTQKRKYN